MRLALLSILLLASSVMAETTNKMSFGCYTESEFNNMVRFIQTKYHDGVIDQIESGKCALLDPGIRVDVLKTGEGWVIIQTNGIKMFMVAVGLDD